MGVKPTLNREKKEGVIRVDLSKCIQRAEPSEKASKSLQARTHTVTARVYEDMQKVLDNNETHQTFVQPYCKSCSLSSALSICFEAEGSSEG